MSSEKKQAGGEYRLPPHSREAEMGVISSLMRIPSLIEDVQAKIDRSAFHIPAHGTIFEMMCALYRLQKPIDFITLGQALADEGTLETVGGHAAIAELGMFVPTAANLTHYLDIVLEKHILRSIIATCTAALTAAYDEQDDVQAVLDNLQSEAIAIGQLRAAKEELQHIGEHVKAALDQIETSYANRGACSGLSTGLVDFDRMTGGLQPGYVYYLAGRPAMGKTALGMNIGEHIAIDVVTEGHGVAVFSVEMTALQLAKRMVCSRANVNLQRMRDGFLAEVDFPKLTNAAAKIIASKMYIVDNGSLSINEFRSLARRAVVKFKVKLIIIDYIQRMRSTSKRAQGNREQEINEIAIGISATAKELQIPIIVLAQLNRGPEQRKGSRPELADLRESGSMEQEAHFVGLLYRPEYYAKTDEEKKAFEGQAILIVAKQREGPVGDITLNFQKEYTRFSSTTEKAYSNNEDERQQY